MSQGLKILLIDMARFYGYDLSERQMEIFIKVLRQFPQELVIQAGQAYMLDMKNERFPIPIHKILKDHIPQEASAKDMARLTSMRIREAITKFGYCNPDEAKAYIGEAGWAHVRRCGGWLYVCQNLGVSINEGTFLAQARDAIESDLNLQKAGIDTSLPAIEQSKERPKVTELISGLAKQKSLEGKV